MSTAIKLSGPTIREFCEQRRIDWLNQEAEAADNSYAAARAIAAAVAFSEVINFLDGAYRQEYIDALQDRIERRRAILAEPTDG